jgi:hypothetical protein
MYVGLRRAEHLSLHSQQRIVSIVEDSVLRTEMSGLESQEEDAPKRILFFKPMSWLGQIRPHRRDEAWSASLWQTFVVMTMGAHIPVIDEKHVATCGCRKFQLDALGDYLCTCTTHSGAKKAHNWVVDQLTELFRTNHKVKTQQVSKNRCRYCGDIELTAYFPNVASPVPLVLDLHIAHDRFGSSSDRSLNAVSTDKIRKYRGDYNNNTPTGAVFMHSITSTSGRLHSELEWFVRFLFLQVHRETDRFFAASGVQFTQTDRGPEFHFHHVVFSSHFKSRVGLVLVKATGLRITLILDGVTITSKSHTHPSHSQTSRLLTSSLSFCVLVPRTTQCIRGV